MPRGRNKDLIDKRNEALCRRWYYWTEVQRLRFDDALKILSEQEFFISEDRVMAIIRQYCKEHPEGDIRPAPKSRFRSSRPDNSACSPGNNHTISRTRYSNVTS